MNFITLVCLFGLVAAAACAPKETYTDKFDNINVDEIVENDRLLEPYAKCVLDQGKCTAEAKELKEHIPDAVETECAKCSDIQQEKIKKVIKHLVNHKPELWDQLTAKYDPSKKYLIKYEKELKELKE